MRKHPGPSARRSSRLVRASETGAISSGDILAFSHGLYATFRAVICWHEGSRRSQVDCWIGPLPAVVFFCLMITGIRSFILSTTSLASVTITAVLRPSGPKSPARA